MKGWPSEDVTASDAARPNHIHHNRVVPGPVRMAHRSSPSRRFEKVDTFLAVLLVNLVAIYFIAHLIASNVICPGVTP